MYSGAVPQAKWPYPVREIDDIVRRSLSSFAKEALDGSWSGRREREAVSFYVFRYLLLEVHKDGFLKDAAQIGIEYPVPQIAGSGKDQVCKDVVLWTDPGMTCWDEAGQPKIAPAAILEWKFGEPGVDERDVAWLNAFSKGRRAFVGYAVTIRRPGSDWKLRCARVVDGVEERDWLRI